MLYTFVMMACISVVIAFIIGMIIGVLISWFPPISRYRIVRDCCTCKYNDHPDDAFPCDICGDNQWEPKEVMSK